MSRYDLIVIGGGWAGLAAATTAVQSGLKVALLERSPILGGRASSFWDRTFEEWLDYGPHLFLGAYRAALSLLDTWQTADSIWFDDEGKIAWLYPDNRTEWMKLDTSGRRLKSAEMLLRFRGMSLVDRIKSLRALYGLVRYRQTRGNDQTVGEYLTGFGIKPGGCAGLWECLTVSVLNGPPSRIGVRALHNAVMEGLLIGGPTARLGFPQKPFKLFFIDPAATFLEESGARLLTSVNVKTLGEIREDGLWRIELDKERIEAEHIILAVPPLDVLRLIPPPWCEDGFFARFKQFEYSSIAAVYINYDRPVLPFRYAYIPGAFSQWIFGRGEAVNGGWSKVSVVISHAPSKRELSSDLLSEQVREDLEERLTEVRNAGVETIRTVRTEKATVLLTPGSSKLRPTVQTPVRNLYLAGDWIDTGLPATIESAARAGIAAAERIIQNH